MKKILFIIFFAITIILFIIGNMINNLDSIFISLCLMYIVSIIYCFLDKDKKTTVLFFLISFFTFLLGKTIILFFRGDNWKQGFSDEIMTTTLNLIFISLFCIILGCHIYQMLIKYKKKDKEIKIKDNKNVEKISGILYYSTYIFLIIVTIEKIILVQTNGYAYLYSKYNSSLPNIISRLSIVSNCAFFIYLSTFPNKKKTLVAIIFYGVYLVLSLLTGERGEIVTGVLLLLIYIIYRQEKNKDINILNKRNIIIIFVISIIMIIFLGMYEDIRQNKKINEIKPLKEITDFFISQGGSIRIITNSIENIEQLKEYNSNYVLGPIINYFDRQNRTKQEEVFDGNNLGATITWLIEPTYYNNGGGMGTQYIAELYVDYGLLGVIIYNIMLGMLLMHCINIERKSWIFVTFNLLIIKSLMFLPRDFSLSFITASILSVNHIITISFVYILAMLLEQKNLKKNVEQK